MPINKRTNAYGIKTFGNVSNSITIFREARVNN